MSDNINEQNPMMNLINDTDEQHHKHYVVKKIESNINEQEKEIIGYDCIYQYENYQIKLEYRLLNGYWKIISDQLNTKQEEELNNLLNNLNLNEYHLFPQQIDIIIQKFDQYFSELKEKENEIIISSLLEEDDDEIKKLNFPSIELLYNNNIPTPSPILEVDEEQLDLPTQSLSAHFQRKIINLTPTTISNRIRLDSACSSTNSIKYAEFVPPTMTSIQRRRIIQSIILGVQRKKKIFEKVLNTLKHIPSEPTMYELGLEFLRVYDGKFNYLPGHTFIMPFKERTWFLTILNIKCMEIEFGESEPRSVLILQYNNESTTVQL
ncbi:unnamed protein product [Adineta steineri]|uniref:Uncharacterized protein n=1 Tax=Adineta steineri TaxID=433720 RepID=A0A815JLW0_9BILA|nr:unnamed protein product [Adineta steineri]CAF1381178.1 unnamed protein product [Adineta steineri]